MHDLPLLLLSSWPVFLPAFLLWALYVFLRRSGRSSTVMWACWTVATGVFAAYGAAPPSGPQEFSRLAGAVLLAMIVLPVGPWLALCHAKNYPHYISLPVALALPLVLMLPTFVLLGIFGQVWGL